MKGSFYTNDLVVDELVNYSKDKEDEIECEGCSLKVNLKYIQVLSLLYFYYINSITSILVQRN